MIDEELVSFGDRPSFHEDKRFAVNWYRLYISHQAANLKNLHEALKRIAKDGGCSDRVKQEMDYMLSLIVCSFRDLSVTCRVTDTLEARLNRYLVYNKVSTFF